MNKVRTTFTLIFLCLTWAIYAQHGYIITKNDSVIGGYVRYQRNYVDQHLEIELWKTKKDKNPKKYPLTTLKEYAIKKDTFKILTDFYPFKNEAYYVPLIELKILDRGRLNLYSTYELDGRTWSAPGAGGAVNMYQTRVITYIMENQDGNLLAIDRQNMVDDLSIFLDYEKFVRKLTDGNFKYKQIPDLIKLYNMRN